MKTYSSPFLDSLLAALLAAGAAAPAFSAPLFTVNEGSIPGAVAQTFSADRINFDHKSIITQTIIGGSLEGADDSFVENGFLSKGSFGTPTGGSVPSQLNANVAGFGYGLYAKFAITGEGDPFGNTGGVIATFKTLSMTLYADPAQNTVLSLTSSTTGTDDDFALANYTLRSGQAHVFNGLANGDFDTQLNVTLTDAGKAYFITPTPFFTTENFGGNTQTFKVIGGDAATGFIAETAGGGLELFAAAVPEPDTYSMLLAGMGTLGLIAMRRRRHG